MMISASISLNSCLNEHVRRGRVSRVFCALVVAQPLTLGSRCFVSFFSYKDNRQPSTANAVLPNICAPLLLSSGGHCYHVACARAITTTRKLKKKNYGNVNGINIQIKLINIDIRVLFVTVVSVLCDLANFACNGSIFE